MKLSAVSRIYLQLSKCCKWTHGRPLGVHCKSHRLSPVGKAQCCPAQDRCDYLCGSGERPPGCLNADVSRKTELYLRLGFACTVIVIGSGLVLYYTGLFPSNNCKKNEKEDVNSPFSRAVLSPFSRAVRNEYSR